MGTLDERILLVWLGATVCVTSIFGLAVGVADHLFVGIGIWLGPAVFVVTTFLGVCYDVLRYRAFRFECRPDALYLERGGFTHVRTVVPVADIRRVDVRCGPLERLVGLKQLVVYPVGGPSATVAIPGLSADHAYSLQDRLQGSLVGREMLAER